MKIIYLLTLILFGNSLFSQQHTFTKFYGGKGYDEGIAAFPVSDSGYILLGNSSAYNTNTSDIWVIHTDTGGNFLWHKSFGTWGYEKIISAIKTTNGDFYMIGSTFQSQSQGYDIYLLGIKETGATICEKYFGGTDWDFGYSLVQDSDSSIVLLGQTQSYGLSSPKAMLIRINLLGDSINAKILPSNTIDYGNEIKSLNNNRYAIAGYSTLNNSTKRNAFVMTLDSNFDSLWRRDFNYFRDSEANSLVFNPDTSVTIVGYIRDSILGHRESWIQRSSTSGVEVYNYLQPQGQENQFYRIIRNNYGIYYVAGISQIWTSGLIDFHISRFHEAGWWMSGETFGSPKNDIPHSLFIDTADFNNVLIAGTSNNSSIPLTSFYFVKTDSMLKANPYPYLVVISGIEDNKIQINSKLYPNPFTNTLTIEFSGNLENAEVLVFDIVGKQIMNARITETTSSLNTSTLPKGVYLVKIVSENKTEFVGKIVKN